HAALSSLYISLFFSLLPRPPSSTLFPYTTLFRSRLRLGFERVADDLGRIDDRPDRGERVGAVDRAVEVDDRRQLAQDLALRELGDRKSTRLNSSHLGISYAVFCLKKKKKEKRKKC